MEIGEEMVLCPYNRCHVVKKTRIQKHILKCRKNYPEISLATCIYNYSHRLKAEDMLQHYKICRLKMRLDGARYYMADDLFCVSSGKKDQETIIFPDSTIKARILPKPKKHSQMDDTDSQQLDSPSSDLEMPHNNDTQDSDNEDDLKPLPLPKTVSKAFVCVKNEPQKSDQPETSKPKGFGRGRNFALPSPSKPPQKTDHLLPDLSDVECDAAKIYKSLWFSTENGDISDDSTCSQSVGSSMLDDDNTLTSLNISLDKNVVIDTTVEDWVKYAKI